MRTITHSELRNHSGEVLRAVAAGETFQVTNRGAVVAELTPPAEHTGAPSITPAKRPWQSHGFTEAAPFAGRDLDAVLDATRAERAVRTAAPEDGAA